MFTGHPLCDLIAHKTDELSGARTKQLEKPMDKIAEMQLGQSEDVQEIEGGDE